MADEETTSDPSVVDQLFDLMGEAFREAGLIGGDFAPWTLGVSKQPNGDFRIHMRNMNLRMILRVDLTPHGPVNVK